MAATRTVHVMISTVVSHGCEIDPPLECEVGFEAGTARWHVHYHGLTDILRTTGVGHIVFSGRQHDILAIGAVNLRLKEEIWITIICGNATRRERVDAAKVTWNSVVSFIPELALCRLLRKT